METKLQQTGPSCPRVAHGVSAQDPSQVHCAAQHDRQALGIASDACAIIVIDHDGAIRDAMHDLFEGKGYRVELFSDCLAFLESHCAQGRSCLLVDEAMLRTSGYRLIVRLASEGYACPTIVMSSEPTLPMAVQAMRAGAFDFLGRPIDDEALLASVKCAIEFADAGAGPADFRETAAQRIATLTPRQHQILNLILAGHLSKNIAADLGISQRTVENHRAEIKRRSGSKSMSGMIQTAICASCHLRNKTTH